MERGEGEIDEAEGHESGGGEVEVKERALLPSTRLSRRLERAGVGIVDSRDEEHGERNKGGDREDGEPVCVTALPCEDAGDYRGADYRARLVHRLVEPERPAAAHVVCRVREHRVPGGVPDGLTETLGHHERGRERPVPGKRERGHSGEAYDVARNRYRPVPARAVAEDSRYYPEAVSDEFA